LLVQTHNNTFELSALSAPTECLQNALK